MNLLYLLKRNEKFLRIVRKALPRLFEQSQRRFVRGRDKLAAVSEANLPLEKLILLRWKEDLLDTPSSSEGDLDFLVRDEDLSIIGKLPKKMKKKAQALDFFSTSGDNGFGKGNYPDFPPRLSNRIFSATVPLTIGRTVIMVPDSDTYFLASAFHVVNHVGPKSNLPYKGITFNANPRRDYRKLLLNQFENTTFFTGKAELDFETIDELLRQQDFSAGLDYSIKVAERNLWIRSKVKKLLESYRSPSTSRLTCFVLQTQKDTTQKSATDFLADYLASLDKVRLKTVSDILDLSPLQEIRSGNWPGSVETSYFSAVIVEDLSVIRFKQRSSDYSYICDNPNLQEAKKILRNKLRKKFGTEFLSLHSSDSSEHARYYIGLLGLDKD
jgi:hypothetical protein